MSSLKHKVLFHFIRYANCWEDADILLVGLNLKGGEKILSVASAGDNALALLATNPLSLHAIDLSSVQLHLTALKQMAIRHLDYRDVLQLLGITENNKQRKKLFESIRTKMPAEAQEYWSNNFRLIEDGLLHSGKFENYFKKFRNYFLPLVHSKKEIAALLQPKTDEEQAAFYEHTWNNKRWKLLMKFFFSKTVMGRYGRDPQFLKHVSLPVSDYIRQKSEQHLRSAACTQNYFLHMIFTGAFGTTLPFYLREENFESISRNCDRLFLHKLSAEEAVLQTGYDVYALSNIFEYMPAVSFENLVKDWMNYIPLEAKLAYWNLMAPRSFSKARPQHFKRLEVSERLATIDKGFFYSDFIIEEKL